MSHRHLVIVGAADAQLAVLHGFVQSQPADLDISFVWPHEHAVCASMVPNLVTGHYNRIDCSINLAKLLAGSRIRHITAAVARVHASTQTVELGNGVQIPYDWLCAPTLEADMRDALEAQMPGARKHALFMHPIEGFARMWPQVAEHARERGMHICVVGAGALGVSLALAMQAALPRSRVSLVAGKQALLQAYPKAAQRCANAALKRLGITVVQESCVGMGADALLLSSGTRLRCDAPMIAQEPSGQAYNDGPQLLAQLRSCIAQDKRTENKPFSNNESATKPHGLNLVDCGERNAIAVWGFWVASGRWVWHWKNVRDRRWIRPLQNPPQRSHLPTATP